MFRESPLIGKIGRAEIMGGLVPVLIKDVDIRIGVVVFLVELSSGVRLWVDSRRISINDRQEGGAVEGN